MFRLFIFSVLLVFGSMTLPSASATVIYSNSITPITATHSDVEVDIQVFDAFKLSSAATVNTVQWRGLYHNTSASLASGADAFSIRFYGDANGDIGPLIGEFHVGNAVNRTATAQIFSRGVPFYQYAAGLGNGINLLAGTQYWVSIQNDTSTNLSSDWFWALEYAPANSKFRLAGHDHDAPDNKHDFILSNNDQMNTVPAPATLTLLGLGLFGIAATRKRKSI
jgi:hypothetical protein